MRHDTLPDQVDHGDYPGVSTPWDDPAWRVRVTDWVQDALDGHGLRVDGRAAVRVRPWSVLLRVPVRAGDGGAQTVWFKANPAGSAFEAGLGQVLSDIAPADVLLPLAVDAGEGWALLPQHAGVLLADAVAAAGTSDGEGVRLWEAPLRQYAALQQTVAPHVDRLAAAGVPDGRPHALPGLLAGLLDSTPALSDADRTALTALLPRFTAWCEELAAIGVPASVDHGDLHADQVFGPDPATGRYTFFDWGDAMIAHPFASFLVTSRVVERRFGPATVARLRAVHLDAWSDGTRSRPDLERALDLAVRLAPVGRACSWARLFPQQGAVAAATAPQSARWLRVLLGEPLD
ncbi:aminoglycoside phosphotransferase family protein [Streptomyces sp. NPDC060194]|uniref:aminoglycoside phosphotransferase family protein n=1 Tax=Streptomyces sp. NPDC060194 TaxID=3347069 RepID=UPI00364BD3DB